MGTMGMVAVLDLEERKETVKHFGRLIGWGNCEKDASPFRAHLRLVIILENEFSQPGGWVFCKQN